MINKFIIIGQMKTNIDFKVTGQGLSMAVFQVAATETYQGKTKENIIPCSFFGQQADEIKDKFKQGDYVCIEGKVTSNKWTNPKTKEEQYFTQLAGQKINKLSLTMEEKPAYEKEYSESFVTEPSEMDNMPF